MVFPSLRLFCLVSHKFPISFGHEILDGPNETFWQITLIISILHVWTCLGFIGMMFIFKENCLHDTPFQQQAKIWN